MSAAIRWILYITGLKINNHHIMYGVKGIQVGVFEEKNSHNILLRIMNYQFNEIQHIVT